MNHENVTALQAIIEAADEQRDQLLAAIEALSKPVVQTPGEKPVSQSGRAISYIKATLADSSWIREQAEKVLRTQQHVAPSRPGVEL